MPPARKRIVFTVRGTYGFPTDMLRYDQAWPTDRGASALSLVMRCENRRPCTACDGTGLQDVARSVTCTTCNGGGSTGWASIEIQLATHSQQITPDRWASFGWYVTEQRSEAIY